MKTYHISNSASFLGVLKFSFKNQKNQKFFYLDFDFNIGPVSSILTENGLKNFIDWNIEKIDLQIKIFSEMQKIFSKHNQGYYYKKFENFFKNIEKIEENDKIFVYFDANASGILFFSYFCNIFEHKNIFFVKYPSSRNKKISYLNTEKINELQKYIRKLTIKKREFYKKFLKNIPDGNMLRIEKNKKIQYLEENFFDEKILQIIAKHKKGIRIFRAIGNIFICDKIPRDWNDLIIFWRICELCKNEKLEIFQKTGKDFLGESRKISFVKIKIPIK